jgi:hypothetical protein
MQFHQFILISLLSTFLFSACNTGYNSYKEETYDKAIFNEPCEELYYALNYKTNVKKWSFKFDTLTNDDVHEIIIIWDEINAINPCIECDEAKEVLLGFFGEAAFKKILETGEIPYNAGGVTGEELEYAKKARDECRKFKINAVAHKNRIIKVHYDKNSTPIIYTLILDKISGKTPTQKCQSITNNEITILDYEISLRAEDDSTSPYKKDLKVDDAYVGISGTKVCYYE